MKGTAHVPSQLCAHEVRFPTDAILRWIDAHAEEIISFAQDLIRIPTVNSPPKGDEKQAQEYLAERLVDIGLEPDLYCLDDLPGLEQHPAYLVGGSVEIPRDYADRPNLACVWKGQGKGRSLLIAGHIDVVSPGDLSQWQHDPWSAVLEEGRIYGRGAVDDKGGLAALLMAMTCLRKLDIRLRGDLVLNSLIDEELGGSNGAVAHLVRGYRADAVIMLEPTDLALCPSTYGCQTLQVSVRGRAAHPIERWKGVDAIGLACQVYESLQDLESRRVAQAREMPLFCEIEIPTPLIVRRLEAFTPGGGSTPDLCDMQVWMTTLPGETQDSLYSQIEEHFAETLCDSPWLNSHPPEVRPMGRFLEATALPLDHELVSVAARAYKEAVGEKPRIAVGTSGDAFVYANYGGLPTLELGPGPVYRAHAPEEYISVDELVAATKILALTIVNWCGVDQ